MLGNRRTSAVLASLMVAFILTLGAGMVVGVAAGRHATAETTLPATRPAEHASPHQGWTETLGLTSQQRDRVRQIWTDAMEGPGQHANMETRMQLFKQRDAALYNLLTDDQKKQYEAIKADINAKLNDLNKEREKSIQEAVVQTKLVLNDQQREKYEQMLKEHGGPFPPHGEHEHGGPHGPGHGSRHGGPSWFGDPPHTQPFHAPLSQPD